MTLLSSERHVAWCLGLAGLLPFIAGGVLAWLAPVAWQASAINGFTYYSAVILSFLGAYTGVACLRTVRLRTVRFKWLALAM